MNHKQPFPLLFSGSTKSIFWAIPSISALISAVNIGLLFAAITTVIARSLMHFHKTLSLRVSFATLLRMLTFSFSPLSMASSYIEISDV